jgi:hypothetical protein
MPPKRKTLPKDFQELLVKGNIQELIQLFDKCEIESFRYALSILENL